MLTTTAGVLEFWDVRKQYGWIISADGKEFFAPLNNFISDTVRPQAGLPVTFLASKNTKGLVACQIEILVPGGVK
jgi:cold shock CspA family protein